MKNNQRFSQPRRLKAGAQRGVEVLRKNAALDQVVPKEEALRKMALGKVVLETQTLDLMLRQRSYHQAKRKKTMGQASTEKTCLSQYER